MGRMIGQLARTRALPQMPGFLLGATLGAAVRSSAAPGMNRTGKSLSAPPPAKEGPPLPCLRGKGRGVAGRDLFPVLIEQDDLLVEL